MTGFASQSGVSVEELVTGVWKSHGNKDGLLEEEGFLAWVCDQVKLLTGEGVKGVWLGLLSSGYDFHFERYADSYYTILVCCTFSVYTKGGQFTILLLCSLYIYYRCGFFSFDQSPCQPTEAQDHALVHHVDSLCRNLATTSKNIDPCDITLSDAHVTSQRLAPLQGTALMCSLLTHYNTVHALTVE